MPFCCILLLHHATSSGWPNPAYQICLVIDSRAPGTSAKRTSSGCLDRKTTWNVLDRTAHSLEARLLYDHALHHSAGHSDRALPTLRNDWGFIGPQDLSCKRHSLMNFGLQMTTVYLKIPLSMNRILKTSILYTIINYHPYPPIITHLKTLRFKAGLGQSKFTNVVRQVIFVQLVKEFNSN